MTDELGELRLAVIVASDAMSMSFAISGLSEFAGKLEAELAAERAAKEEAQAVERARIVACLREDPDDYASVEERHMAKDLADYFERGGHWEPTSPTEGAP